MKLSHMDYKPKKRRYTILYVMDTIMLIGTAMLWINSRKLEISVSDLMIISGLVLLALILANNNRKSERELKVEDEHIEKLKENMGKDQYNDNERFFK